MRLRSSTSLALVIFLSSPNGAITKGHPKLPLHPKFRSHIKCPYADKWLSKGAEEAARELGLDKNGRKLQAESIPIPGSCSYSNAFSGGTSCMNFRGSSWAIAEMEARCAEESGGSFSADECANEAAGWCVTSVLFNKEIANQMMLSPMADCDGNKMACETFIQGTFEVGSLCSEDVSTVLGQDEDNGHSWSTMEVTGEKCILAPGAIGAAHQAGFSSGYSSSCPNTPAQDSPYMWPLKWSADTEFKSMAYGSDEIVYTSRGKTFYSLDNNWKRSDTTYQNGVLRAIGQGPCENPDDESTDKGLIGCNLNQTDNSISTMIHKGNKMYFVSWKDNENNPAQVGELDVTKIEECSMINLAVIGNIRPDWFMDKRGDDTDVQYIGDQHVFYSHEAEGAIPKLVKQWRKKDFASQYFVMSMMGNPPNKLEKKTDAPVEDDVHWPLILNIPGEGFGDDALSVYRNHKLLTEEDDGLFMIVEEFEENGGVCSEVGGEVGPPVLDVHIPSNLEVEEFSWISNEYTFSPVWQVPSEVKSVNMPVTAGPPSKKEITKVSDRVTVESCYDSSAKAIDMSVHFHDVEPTSDGKLPWMSLGYRSSDICSMTPIDGGNTPLVLITHEDEDKPPLCFTTDLVPAAKSMNKSVFESMSSLKKPMEQSSKYMDVSIDAPIMSNMMTKSPRSSFSAEDTVTLNFKQIVDEKPDTMNLMFAIGMTSDLGFHTTRGCFQLDSFPSCPQVSEDINEEENASEDETISSSSIMPNANAGVTLIVASFVATIVAL